MSLPQLLTTLMLLACQPTTDSAATVVASVPTFTTDVGQRWHLVHQRPDGIAVRLGTTAHGIRIDLGPGGGITPIAGGRSPHNTLGTAMLELPYPAEHVQSVSVQEQGIDLVIRISGPPLNTLTSDPQAPSDPVLTWVRVRDRGDTWRIALQGIALWHLPSPTSVQHTDRTGVIVSTAQWGSWHLTTDATALRSSHTERWTLDLQPSIDARQPYPLTSATWTDPRLRGASPRLPRAHPSTSAQ